MRKLLSRALLAAAIAALAACGGGSRHEQPAPEPVLTSADPAQGGLGAIVTLSGRNFSANPHDNAITIAAPAQGTVTIAPIFAASNELRFVVPLAAAETAQISVSVAGKTTDAVAFEIQELTDPTPDTTGNELAAFYGLLDATLAELGEALEGALLPFMDDNGQGDEAGRIRTGLGKLREGFSQWLTTAQAAEGNEAKLAFLDGVCASDAIAQVAQHLDEAEQGLVAPADNGLGAEVLDGLRRAARLAQEGATVAGGLDAALGVAEQVAPATDGVSPMAAAHSDVITPLAQALAALAPILDAVPTQPIGGTLATTVVENDLRLNQGFGSMAQPIAPELNPGVMLVVAPYGVAATADFRNNGKQSLPLREDGGIDGLSDLTGFDIEEIHIHGVAVPLRLLTDQSDVFEGSWSDGRLLISALQPGEGEITLRADLPQVANPDAGGTCAADVTCIPAEALQIIRTMKAVAGDQDSGPFDQGAHIVGLQVEGLPAGQAYIGDTLTISGEGLALEPQNANQTVTFQAAPGQGPDVGKVAHDQQINNGYTSLDVEVPDTFSGGVSVSLADFSSNQITLTILPPQLQAHSSAIAGETWPVSGRGFSHTLINNRGNFNGLKVTPFAPDGEAAHRRLVFTVPDDVADGPFRVATIGRLESNTVDVTARHFGTATALSPLGREGLRPAVARNADGDRVVAWMDHNAAGGNQLVAALLPAGAAAFSTPVVVSTDVGGLPGAPARPALAATSGRYYLAWISGDNRVLFSSSTDGLAWPKPKSLASPDETVRQPALAADGDLVVVAWTEEAVTEAGNAILRYRISSNGGVKFEDVRSGAGSDAADAAVAVAGQSLVIAWSAADGDKRNITVLHSSDAGGHVEQWSAGAALARRPSVAIGRGCIQNNTDSIYLAWENTEPGAGAEDVWFARWDGADEGVAPVNISASEAHSQTPALSVDGDCTPSLAWVEQDAASASLVFTRSFDDGATFNMPFMTLATGTARLGHPALAAAGRANLTLAYQDDATSQVMLRTTEGAPTATAVQPENLAAEPNLDMVIRSYAGDLFASSPDGSHLRRLTRGVTAAGRAALSPDGRRLAYLAGGNHLVVADADGAHPVFVASDDALRGSVWWSPESTYIAVGCIQGACSPGAPTVAWLKPDGSGLMTTAGGIGLQPWSPDGRLVYGTGDIEILDPVSGEATVVSVTLPEGRHGYYPAWSPDGRRIAFVASTDADVDWEHGRYGEGDIYVMDTYGTNLARLTAGKQDATPVWSPDGGTIAFTRRVGSVRQIMVIDAGGTGLPRNLPVESGSDDTLPFFLPDGSATGAWRVPEDGNGRVEVFDLAGTAGAQLLTPATGNAGPGAAFHYGAPPQWPEDAFASVSDVAISSAVVAWTAAADDVGVNEYQVFVDGVLRGTGDSPYTVTGLRPESTYTVNVAACDAAGNCSDRRLTATVTTLPNSADNTPPVWSGTPSLTISASVPLGQQDPVSYAADLQWPTATDDGDVSYRVYRDNELVLTTTATPRDCKVTDSGIACATVSDLRPETLYRFDVEACDGAGNCAAERATADFTTGADTKPPALDASVQAARLELRSNEPLDAAQTPGMEAFSVTVNGAAAAIDAVTMDSTNWAVVLTLAAPVFAADTVTLDYTPGVLQDLGGNLAAALTGQTVKNNNRSEIKAMATDSTGNIYVAGAFEGAVTLGDHALIATGPSDAFIAMSDADGAWQWALGFGGPGRDTASGMAVDGSGNVFVTGSLSGTTPFDSLSLATAGESDLFVAKLDASRHWVWAVGTGGATDRFADGVTEAGEALALDSAGNVYVAGRFAGTATPAGSGLALTAVGATDILAAKLDANGVWQWAAQAGGFAGDNGAGITADATGVYVTGTFQGQADFRREGDIRSLYTPQNAATGMFVAGLDDAGHWLWADDGGSNGGSGTTVVTDGAGNVYVAGAVETLVFDGTKKPIPVVGKWGSDGNLTWWLPAAVSQFAQGSVVGMALDANGYLYVGGDMSGFLSFGDTALAAYGPQDIFAARIDPAAGAWQWAINGRGGVQDYDYVQPQAVTSCGAGVICLGGYISGSGDVMFGGLSLNASGDYSVYVAKAGDSATVTGQWLSVFGP